MKNTIVLKEINRSFTKHVFINLLLMVQFVICFFLLTTVITYYVQIGNTDVATFIDTFDNEKWNVVRTDRNASWDNITSIAQEPDGLTRLQGFYQELNDNAFFKFLSFRDGQGVYLNSEMMDSKFGKSQYNDLICNGDGEISIAACYNEIEDADRSYLAVYINSVQMDLPAYKVLHLKLLEGEGFTEENRNIDSDQSYVPIILGYAYKDHFKVGETFRMAYPTMGSDDHHYNVKVVGILEKGSYMPAYIDNTKLIDLDYQLIFPTGLRINYIPKDSDIRAKYAHGLFSENIQHSYICLYEGVEYIDAIAYAHELSQKYEVYDLRFTSTSFGMDMLRKESQTTIAMISILSLALLAFTLFFLFSSCINRIRQNTRTYAIYLMTGVDIRELAAAFLLEMLILFIPAVILNYFLLEQKMFISDNYGPYFLVLGIALSIFIVCSVFVIIKLRGVQTEELMRRKE